MSKQLLISLLRKGANGQEILSILDVITGDAVTEEQPSCATMAAVPTLDEIPF